MPVPVLVRESWVEPSAMTPLTVRAFDPELSISHVWLLPSAILTLIAWAAEPAPADLAPAEPAATPATGSETLPVPNYDQLSVASLRARLRVLDADQVQVLLDYEKAHEGRPAVTTMFERRLTKLSEGS